MCDAPYAGPRALTAGPPLTPTARPGRAAVDVAIRHPAVSRARKGLLPHDPASSSTFVARSRRNRSRTTSGGRGRVPDPPFTVGWRRGPRARGGPGRVRYRRLVQRLQAVGPSPAQGPVEDRQGGQLGELDAVPRLRRQDEDVPDAGELREDQRDQGDVRRGHRGQRLVLRKDPGPAEERPGHRQGRHRLHRLDGRPGDPAGLYPETRQDGHSERQEPAAEPAERRLRPGSQLLTHLAVRLRRPRLEQGQDPRRHEVRLGLVEAGLQGQGRGAHRIPGHDGPDHARAGRRHLQEFHRRPVRQCHRRAGEAAQLRPDPPGQGQLLQGGPDLGGRLGGDRLVR